KAVERMNDGKFEEALEILEGLEGYKEEKAKCLYSLAVHNVGSVFTLLGGQAVPFSSHAVPMLLAFILVGILAGAVGSIVSMARYLKEQGSVIADEA
ncbi:MAG: hypothetical protein J5847_05190, partial [Clostridia bacterium]|nr:hypothetical protein [Clostridia bacterium]